MNGSSVQVWPLEGENHEIVGKGVVSSCKDLLHLAYCKGGWRVIMVFSNFRDLVFKNSVQVLPLEGENCKSQKGCSGLKCSTLQDF